MRHILAAAFWVAVLVTGVRAHDIPNARVDRSIQVTLSPPKLEIDYEVSLSELTLVQDLRALIGTLPAGEREAWFDRYGKETAPLNARGFLVNVDREPIELQSKGFSLAVEQHPRYTFHFEAALPARGKLVIRDTNFAASEGTSRLALRRGPGVLATGDDLPEDVERIPIRPVWQLTSAEEKRTKRLEVSYGPAPQMNAAAVGESSKAPPAEPGGQSSWASPSAPTSGLPGRSLSRLLDPRQGIPLALLWLMAVSMGAAHAIQPGHGKTLVAAATIAERGGWRTGFALAILLTLAHTGSVVALAIGLWATRSTRYAEINTALAHVAGFAIAAVGCWRLGRQFSRADDLEFDQPAAQIASPNLFGLALAGGLLPCWDAVVLVIFAEALGRLRLGLFLLLGFSIGLAIVLVAVGLAAARLRGLAERYDHERRWERRLGVASALALLGIGLYLMR
jgi:ABC-type nickel/cobalt efflux system permease component RcnA